MNRAPVWKLPNPSSEIRDSVTNNHGVEFNRRVLIVEDEAEITEAYRAILSPTPSQVIPIRRSSRAIELPPMPASSLPKYTFDLTVVSNASDALDAVEVAVAQGKPFAVGFFDVVLGPGMDGVDLVRRIHTIDPEMYAVFVTAYNDRSVESINNLLGEDKADRWDYLNKPFSEGEIFQKARNAITFWNVTHERDQKNREMAVIRQKLLEQEKIASVAALARSVGHEFGNILMQIMGRADLSMRGDAEQMRSALEVILKASMAASKILDRFKSLARSYDADLDKESMDMIKPISESLDLLEHQIEKMGVTVEIESDLSMNVFANHFSLLQVFMNLIINSLHAMDEDPRKIKIEVSQEGDMAQVRFYDTGPGIPSEILDKVGQPFFTTKGREGTGLGLAICREIVEIEHGGRFSVGNRLSGQGAEFVLELPLVDPTSEVDRG